MEQENCATGPPPEILMEETVEAELRWKDITQLLQDKLSTQAFDTILRYIPHFHTCQTSHSVVILQVEPKQNTSYHYIAQRLIH